METVSFSFVGMGLKFCRAGRISKPEQIVRRSGREAISFFDRIVIASPRSNLILKFQPYAGYCSAPALKEARRFPYTHSLVRTPARTIEKSCRYKSATACVLQGSNLIRRSYCHCESTKQSHPYISAFCTPIRW
jgi:hypothetical protein